MEASLIRVYEEIPTWLPAIVYVIAAGGFVHMFVRAQRGTLVISPPVALTVAASLLLVALFYLLIAPMKIPLEAKGGFLRLILLVLGGVLIVFNLSSLMGRNERV